MFDFFVTQSQFKKIHKTTISDVDKMYILGHV
jgi:hypothetical protein